MGVSNQAVKVVVIGNGAQTIFNYGFLIPSTGSWELIYTDANGINTTLAQSAYVVNNLDSANGGTFQYPLPTSGNPPIAGGTTLTLIRTDSYTSNSNFEDQNNYNPSALQTAIDMLTLQTQQLAEGLSRAIMVPPNETAFNNVLPTAIVRSNNGSGSALDFDGSGNIILGNPDGSGGGTITLPANAPLIGSNSSGAPQVVVVGTGLVLSGGTLTAQATNLPPNAPLLGTDGASNATSIALGTGLSITSGTLNVSAANVPANAALLGSNSGSTLTAVALGAGVAITAGTLTVAAAALPSNAFILGSNSGGTAVTVPVGQGLSISGSSPGGTLFVNTPLGAPLLGTGSVHGQFVKINLGSGLSITTSGGTSTLNINANSPPINAPLIGTNVSGVFTPVVAGSGISISGGTITATAATVPANAALLASNSGATLTAITLGAGLSINSGTLSSNLTLPASAQLIGSNSGGTAVAVVAGSGLTLSAGTLTANAASVPANAALLASNSTSTLTAVTLGAGLAISSGTLSVTAAAPPVSAPYLYTNSGGTLLAGVLGAGLAITGTGTLTNTNNLLPTSAALLQTNAGGTATALALGTGLSQSGTVLNALAAPAAGIVNSNGTTLGNVAIGAGLTYSAGTLSATGTTGVTSIVAAGLLTGGTITSTGTIGLAAPSAGIVYSTGSALTDLVIGANLTLSAGTLSAAGSGSITLTDGTNTVSGVTTLHISGSGTVSGSSPNGTVTISGGGGGGGASTWDLVDNTPPITFSNGNLTAATSNSGDSGIRSTLAKSSGKLYFEITVVTVGSGNVSIGVNNCYSFLNQYLGQDKMSIGYTSQFNVIYFNGANMGGFGANTNGDVYGVAVILNPGSVDFYIRRNTGNWNNNGSANPSTGVGGIISGGAAAASNQGNLAGFLKSGQVYAAVTISNNATITANFGATSFVNGPPSGFSAWG